MGKVKSKYPERLYLELRRKFWKRSDSQLVCHDVFLDINTLKKYYGLNLFQMANLFIHVTIELDGHDVTESFIANWHQTTDVMSTAFIYAFD